MVVCRDSGWRFDGAARCGLLTRLLFHVKHDPSAESANRTDARGALLCTIQSTVGALATRVAVIRPGKSPTECVTVTFRCLDPPRPVADSVGDVAAHGGSANSHHGRPRSAVDGHVCRTRRESPKPFIARPGSRPVRSSGCRVAVSAAAVTPGQFRVLAARTAAVTLRRVGIPAPRVATGQRHRSLLGSGYRAIELSRDASVRHRSVNQIGSSSDPSRLLRSHLSELGGAGLARHYLQPGDCCGP